ncbi:MAG: hypothetical protein IJ716_14630 [Lachnospiraceae bacterium]|nr:hypothetical protein [Lachnospiraceae bacterium]
MSFIKRWMEDIHADYQNNIPMEEISEKYGATSEEIEEIVNILSSEN